MSAATEFFRIAEEAGTAKARFQEVAIRDPLAALRASCEEAERAWSGSNIGYHATVYYRGLQAKPPHAQFSAEWGLEDRWPVSQPDPGWEMMDYEAVSQAVVSRATKSAVKSAETALDAIRDEFGRLKEDAISVFISLGKSADDYLLRQRRTVEDCKPRLARAIAAGFLPSGGTIWSRDSLAMSQGLQVAPHQSWIALPHSAVELERAIDQLQKAAQQAATHLERINPSENSGAFVGAGRAFDAFKALGKVLASAKKSAFIVDPYMDEKVLTDFAEMVHEGVVLMLLADEQHHKRSLAPAAKRWMAQWGTARPLEARLGAPRSLHDRVIIIDNTAVWILTQSFNAFATRAPASIVQADPETASLKIAAYQALWHAAKPMA